MVIEQLFRVDNSFCYTQMQRDMLNLEWDGIVEEFELETGSDEYHIRQKQFCDDVSRRRDRHTKETMRQSRKRNEEIIAGLDIDAMAPMAASSPLEPEDADFDDEIVD